MENSLHHDSSPKLLKATIRRKRHQQNRTVTTQELAELAIARLSSIYPQVVEVLREVPAKNPVEHTVTLQCGKYLLSQAYPRKTPYRQLKYLLLAHILLQEESLTNEEEALSCVARVIGFQASPINYPLDYAFSIGQGQLACNLNLQCLVYSNAIGLNSYLILKCLAIGGFSKVYLVRSLHDGRFLAMKVMDKRFIFQNEKESVVENQKDICSQLDHPFIVKLEHSFETRNFTYFIMEYCPGGELFYLLKRVKRMSEQDARFYFTEILYGLQYLHEKGIVYRDLKPENLLIGEDGHIKIADFGLSKQGMTRDHMTYSYCGSAEYMPPEMILRAGHGFGVDYYTLGALLYQLVTGLPPYYSRDQNKVRDCILYQELNFPPDLTLSEELENLLRGLLHKNQKLRLGCLSGIKQVLFHPWMGKIDSRSVLQKKKRPPYLPDINELNFDETELGEDQAEFTGRLRRETRLKQYISKRHFPHIEYESNNSMLSVAHRNLLAKEAKHIKKCTSLTYSERRDLHHSNSRDRHQDKVVSHSPYLQKLIQSKHSSSAAGLNKHYFGQMTSQSTQKPHNQTTFSDIRRIYWPHPQERSNIRQIPPENSAKRRILQNIVVNGAMQNNTTTGKLVPLKRSPNKRPKQKNISKIQRNPLLN